MTVSRRLIPIDTSPFIPHNHGRILPESPRFLEQTSGTRILGNKGHRPRPDLEIGKFLSSKLKFLAEALATHVTVIMDGILEDAYSLCLHPSHPLLRPPAKEDASI